MGQNQISQYTNRENLDPQTMYICLKRDKPRILFNLQLEDISLQ